MAKKKYFDAVEEVAKIEKQVGYKIDHFMCISARGKGKTFSPLKYAFEQWIKTDGKHQLAYIRRWDTDFQGKTGASSIYGSLMNDGNHENQIAKISKGQYDVVEYRGGAYYVGRTNSENGKVTWNRRTPIAYGISLNLWERTKSSGVFGYVETILVDEYISAGHYLSNEFQCVMNCISTIVRDRKTPHVYYMANVTSLLGYPCWEDWGLQNEIISLKQGDCRTYKYEKDGEVTRLALLWLDMPGDKYKTTESSSFFAFDTRSTNMITNGEMDIPSYPHIPDGVEIRPMDIVFEFFITYRKQLFHAELCDIDGNRFTFIHKKSTPIKNPNEDCVFTDDIHDSWRDNYSYGFRQKTDKLHTKIRDWLNSFPLYFDTNTTGYIFYTYHQQTQDTSGKK